MSGGKKPKWDTELGRLLYLDGRTDDQIAEELGVSKTAVTNYRLRHWGRANEGKKETDVEVEDAVHVAPPNTITAQQPDPKPVSMATPEGVYSILEEATKTKGGIEAICTADAILCLWNWDSVDDLRRARAAINHLIKRLEG